uniref:Uncharacterized protein n=1 Tax=Naja naja TaxID=35670 RepID=A0A8C6V3F5_NAJNA
VSRLLYQKLPCNLLKAIYVLNPLRQVVLSLQPQLSLEFPLSRYFIHDSLDIIICRQSRASWEYLVHHAVASSGGEGRLWGRRRGWPVSNIFLTLRMMMRLGKLPSPPSTRSTSTSTWPPLPLPPGPKAYLTWFFAPRGDARQAPFLMVNLVLLDAMILMYFSRLRARLLSGGHRRLGRRRST